MLRGPLIFVNIGRLFSQGRYSNTVGAHAQSAYGEYWSFEYRHFHTGCVRDCSGILLERSGKR